MSLFRSLLSKTQLHSLLKTPNPLFLPSLHTKTLTSSPQNEPKTKKPLDILFKEAVGLCEKVEENNETQESEKSDFNNKLLGLEREIRRLNAESKNEEVNVKKIKNKKPEKAEKAESLYALFVKRDEIKEKKIVIREEEEEEEPRVFKELSPEMEVFVSFLYEKGYFNKANFLVGNKLDFSYFENSYGRDFIKFAAEKFGKDHQEIAKWLSGSDLKTVALFGCPSLGRKNVFSAKRLRNYFNIQENTVCSKCLLKDKCKFVNQSVWRGDTKNLNLAVVMRVITLYALEAVPVQLAVPDEIKASINRLLKDVINLSKTTA